MLSMHEINLLEAQNEALKKQNASLQAELRRKDEQLEAVSKELDEYIQNLSKPEFERLIKGIRCQHLVLDECSQSHHDNCHGVQQCILDLEAELKPLTDEYFNGLTTVEIAELAKKSIRLIAENRELEKENTELKEKENFQINHYRKALEEIEEIIKYRCDDCGNYRCEICYLKDILDIISEVKGD